MNPLAQQLVEHDLDDTRALFDAAKALDDDAYRSDHLPGVTIVAWDGVEDSIAAVLEHVVWTKEVWLAAIEGSDLPDRGVDHLPSLVARHDAVAGRWLAVWRDVDRRGAWDDRLVDALCDPPESFVMSSVLAHVLTFTAHRRQLVRVMLRCAGHEIDHGDPIEWLRARLGEDR